MADPGQQPMPFGYAFDQYMNQSQSDQMLQPTGPPLLEPQDRDLMNDFFNNPNSHNDTTYDDHYFLPGDDEAEMNNLFVNEMTMAGFSSLAPGTGQPFYGGQQLPQANNHESQQNQDYGYFDNSSGQMGNVDLSGNQPLLHERFHAPHRIYEPTTITSMQQPAALPFRDLLATHHHMPEDGYYNHSHYLPHETDIVGFHSKSEHRADEVAFGASTPGQPFQPPPSSRFLGARRHQSVEEMQSEFFHQQPQSASHLRLLNEASWPDGALHQNQGKRPALRTFSDDDQREIPSDGLENNTNNAANPRKHGRTKSEDLDSGSDAGAMPPPFRYDESTIRSSSTAHSNGTSTPAAKRRKSAASGTKSKGKSKKENLTPGEKRQHHVESEKRRRDLTSLLFDQVKGRIPALQNYQGTVTRCNILKATADYLENLIERNERAAAHFGIVLAPEQEPSTPNGQVSDPTTGTVGPEP